jgi:hypothetical protein
VSNIIRARIVKLYRRATYCYALPFVFLVLALVGISEGVFLGAFFVGLLPLAVAGLYLTATGLRLSFDSNDYEKKDVGYANLLLGLILSAVGLMALGFAYLGTSL